MYDSKDSYPRADISTLLMEALGQEKLFIGQMLMPVYPSGTIVGRYPKFKIGSGNLLGGTQVQTARNVTGTYNETDRQFEWDSFITSEYGVEERVDDVVAKMMANFFDAEMVTSKALMNNFMMDYESQVASLINSGTTYFNGVNASIPWIEANTAGATPFDVPKVLNYAVEQLTLLGEYPGVIMECSLSTWNLIRRSQKLQTYLYGYLNVTQGGSQVTEEMVARAFGIDQVIIAKKSINTSLRGLEPDGPYTNLNPIWGNDYVFIGRVGEGDFMNGGVGRTIIWDADAPGGLFTTESYRDERRRGSMLRIRSNRVLKVINPNAGFLVATGTNGTDGSHQPFTNSI